MRINEKSHFGCKFCGVAVYRYFCSSKCERMYEQFNIEKLRERRKLKTLHGGSYIPNQGTLRRVKKDYGAITQSIYNGCPL